MRTNKNFRIASETQEFAYTGSGITGIMPVIHNKESTENFTFVVFAKKTGEEYVDFFNPGDGDSLKDEIKTKLEKLFSTEVTVNVVKETIHFDRHSENIFSSLAYALEIGLFKESDTQRVPQSFAGNMAGPMYTAREYLTISIPGGLKTSSFKYENGDVQ